MKDDPISRQAAIRWVKTECNPYGKPTLDFESGKKVIEHLEQMPSAQPEAIRCKNCKYNPKKSWLGCPMPHLSEGQRETAWCWNWARRGDE